MWVYFWALYSVSLNDMSLFVHHKVLTVHQFYSKP